VKYLLLISLSLCGCCEPEGGCKHTFSKWGPLEKTQDWSYGPRFWQSRTCETCGFAETRRTR
jgi:hypothetical protein